MQQPLTLRKLLKTWTFYVVYYTVIFLNDPWENDVSNLSSESLSRGGLHVSTIYTLDTMMKPYEDHLPNSISMKALIIAIPRLPLSRHAWNWTIFRMLGASAIANGPPENSHWDLGTFRFDRQLPCINLRTFPSHGIIGGTSCIKTDGFLVPWGTWFCKAKLLSSILLAKPIECQGDSRIESNLDLLI